MIMEPRRTGAFLLSEANGQKSRDNVVVDASVALPVGIALGFPPVTEGEVATAVPYDAADPAQIPCGFLWEAVPALGAGKTVKRAVIARDAEIDWRQLEQHTPAVAGDVSMLEGRGIWGLFTFRNKPAA